MAEDGGLDPQTPRGPLGFQGQARHLSSSSSIKIKKLLVFGAERENQTLVSPIPRERIITIRYQQVVAGEGIEPSNLPCKRSMIPFHQLAIIGAASWNRTKFLGSSGLRWNDHTSSSSIFFNGGRLKSRSPSPKLGPNSLANCVHYPVN